MLPFNIPSRDASTALVTQPLRLNDASEVETPSGWCAMQEGISSPTTFASLARASQQRRHKSQKHPASLQNWAQAHMAALRADWQLAISGFGLTQHPDVEGALVLAIPVGVMFVNLNCA